jgi:ATP-binding cassette subfamily B protein
MTEMQSRVDFLLRAGEHSLLVTETDIDADGRFGRRWLAVTSKRLMVFDEDGQHAPPSLEFSLSDVRSVRSLHLVGRVALEAEADGRRVELLRGTNSMAGKLGRIAKSLNDACGDGKTPEFDMEALREEEERHCPKCGRLLPEKGSFCPACLRKGEVLARLWRYIRPYGGRMVLVMALTGVSTAVDLAPPLVQKKLVDDVLMDDGQPFGLLAILVLTLLVLRMVSTVTGIVRGRLSAWLGSGIIHDVRFDVYQSIQGLTLRRHDKTQTGSLLSRLTGDTNMLQYMFMDIGTMVLPSLLQLVGICVIMLVLKWWLALLVLLPTPFMGLAMAWFHRRLHGLYHRVWQRRAAMTARANDSISGVRVVKAFSQEEREVDHFGRRSRDYFVAAATAESLWATAFPAMAFVISLGFFMVWYFGGVGVLKDDVTLGTLTAFITYLAMFITPLHMLTHFANHMNRAFTAAQRLFEITDADQEVYDDPEAVPMPQVTAAIRFEDVHFGYVADRPVLKGMNLDVKPGEMIGLVGKSGAGKTTVCNLICRFYDVDEGSITLDGVDLRKIKLRDLRRHVAIVPQECFLFDGTIAENIGYAVPEATRDDVIRAAIAANAHGFIMRQPDGYDTKVGERGGRLSQGEKQRIAIARALICDPRILILDEATSSVDTETEALIQTALERLVEGRTTFAIAHRLSTLRNADRLLVIEEGKEGELGTHDELLEKKGIYYKLVSIQSQLSKQTLVGG